MRFADSRALFEHTIRERFQTPLGTPESPLANHAAPATADAIVGRSASERAHRATSRSSSGSHSTFATSRFRARTVHHLASFENARIFVSLAWHPHCSTESRHVAHSRIKRICGARQKMRGGVSQASRGAPRRTEVERGRPRVERGRLRNCLVSVLRTPGRGGSHVGTCNQLHTDGRRPCHGRACSSCPASR